MSRRNDCLTRLRERAVDVFCAVVAWAFFKCPDTTIAVLKIFRKDLTEAYLAWLKPILDECPGITIKNALEIASYSLAYKELLATVPERTSFPPISIGWIIWRIKGSSTQPREATCWATASC